MKLEKGKIYKFLGEWAILCSASEHNSAKLVGKVGNIQRGSLVIFLEESSPQQQVQRIRLIHGDQVCFIILAFSERWKPENWFEKIVEGSP